MSKTNYKLKNNVVGGMILYHLNKALETGTIGIDQDKLTDNDVCLAQAIISDLEELGTEVIEDSDFFDIHKTKQFNNFPKSCICNFMECFNIACDSDETPIKSVPLLEVPESKKDDVKQIESRKDSKSSKKQKGKSKTNQQPEEPIDTKQVCQFTGEGLNYTILPDGSVAEAKVDEEITEWFNLYNFRRGANIDPNTFDNTIIKLRSIIPKLKNHFKKTDNHSVYQFLNFISPTNFVLADVSSGQQLVVNDGQVLVQQ